MADDVDLGVSADEVEAEAVDWLWRERIPRKMLTVVAGKPDQGKSLFASHVAADITARGGNVLYSAWEDDHGIMTRPRLEAAGADLKRCRLWPFRVPEQLDELDAMVKKHTIDLIVIDPFNAHLSSGVNRFSDSIRKVTTPLKAIAAKYHCGVIITEHALKKIAKDAHPLNAIGGNSSGLVAAVRMGFIFGVDPEDEDRRVLCNVKHNVSPERPAFAFDTDLDDFDLANGDKTTVPSLVLMGETVFDARRLLQVSGDGKPGRKPDKRAQAGEWLATHMAIVLEGKKTPAGVIFEDAKQFGVSGKTVRRAAEDLGVIKDPPGGGRSCTWELPDELLKAMNSPAADGKDSK